jgi:hypothetical protein
VTYFWSNPAGSLCGNTRRRGVPRGDVVLHSSAGGRSVIVTSRGMMRGYYRIELSDGTPVASGYQSKSAAIEQAYEVARRGEFNAGISGFPRMERL